MFSDSTAGAGGRRHEIVELKCSTGELSFEARIGETAKRIWFRTDTPVDPNADAALAASLMPAMGFGGTLSISESFSPRLMRGQREFQAIQRAWSHQWQFGDPPLEEVDVLAPTHTPKPEPDAAGRVAALFSGGVDSWSTIVDHPELTDLVFMRGYDLMPGAAHQAELIDKVETRLRNAARDLGLRLHVVDTNLRENFDPLTRWEAYSSSAAVAGALFVGPLFERVLIASGTDHEVQEPLGTSRSIPRLWSTERLEIADDGGRYNRVERTARVAAHPVAQRTLRVCWETPDGAYNCGRCKKCLMTMVTLEALGVREQIATFPPGLDLGAVTAMEIATRMSLGYWEDMLDAARVASRADLEQAVEAVVVRCKRRLGLPPGYRRRSFPGPPPSIRIAAIIPAWRQAEYVAAAVDSALAQQIDTGVGVVIVNDGCPDLETDRIGQALRDAHPGRVAYLRQPNSGLSAARNAGIRHAFARWPHLEAVFPLDADNMLSVHTLADLRLALDEHPDAAWASPALEFFGGEDGEWAMPGPYLSYRQLFNNQSDAGSLIRRSVFEAGIEFDESMTEGFEDWEFFLRASLAGFRGAPAGRCGFRYRRRPGSMLASAEAQSEELEAGLRLRHPAAYRPEALARREHAEAPRFGLIRCDAGDVLLTAACDLEPHRMPIERFLQPRRHGADVAPVDAHVPAIAVLTTAATIEWLAARDQLAEVLMQLQLEVRDVAIVGLRLVQAPPRLRLSRRQRETAAPVAALALRSRTLATLVATTVSLEVEAAVELQVGRARLPRPLSELVLGSAVSRLRSGVRSDLPLIRPGSHAEYFEHRHIDLRETTPPSSVAAGEVAPAERLAA
jgi:hypothetical protein